MQTTNADSFYPIPQLPSRYIDTIKGVSVFFDEIEKIMNEGGRFNKKTLKTIIIRIERLCNELDMKLNLRQHYLIFMQNVLKAISSITLPTNISEKYINDHEIKIKDLTKAIEDVAIHEGVLDPIFDFLVFELENFGKHNDVDVIIKQIVAQYKNNLSLLINAIADVVVEFLTNNMKDIMKSFGDSPIQKKSNINAFTNIAYAPYSQK